MRRNTKNQLLLLKDLLKYVFGIAAILLLSSLLLKDSPVLSGFYILSMIISIPLILYDITQG